MKVNCMIAAVVVFAVFCFAVNNVRAHMHMMMNKATAMSLNGKFQLQWTYDKDTGMFYFNMKCKDTAGWCGVGFADSKMNSDGKGMKNYDIAIGGKRGDDQYLEVSFLTTSFILLFLVPLFFFFFLFLFFVACSVLKVLFKKGY